MVSGERFAVLADRRQREFLKKSSFFN